MGSAIDLTEQKFRKLTAKYATTERSSGGGIIWACLCECGNPEYCYVPAGVLRYGGIDSCGTCYVGYSHLPEFPIWMSMRSRCRDPGHKQWKDYGGRGITVCERWEIFENFYADMGPRPSPKHWLDRWPDNNSGYRKDNCRWATPTEQQRNRRSNTLYTIGVTTHCLTEWCEIYNMHVSTVISRQVRGMSIEEALSRPVRSHREIANDPAVKKAQRDGNKRFWDSLTPKQKKAKIASLQANNPNHQKISPR